MSNNEHINQQVNRALDSLDGASRASAKPFLFTRIQAAMQRRPETLWERAGRFIARPSVAIAGLCLVLAVNLAAVINSSNKPDLQEEATINADDFSSTVAVVYDIDNNEP
jgi:uncharacterized membrane protein YdfJ with MMPL/SSD domain